VNARASDAQSLFDEGLSDMRAGRFKIGCALIKQSLEIDARAGTVFTLAECYSKAGKYASAVAFYDRYLAVFETMPEDQKEQQQARAELSRTERTRLVALVAWLSVSLPENAPQGAVVTMDGEPFSPALFGVATAADPGPHVFTTRAPDGPLIEQRVDLAPGERRAMVLSLRTSTGELTTPIDPSMSQPEPEPEPEPSGDTHGKHLTPWFWVAGGIGAAGIVTGTVTGIMLLNARSTIMKNCYPDRKTPTGEIPCDSSGADAAHTAQGTLAPVTTIALGVGVASLAAAVAIYLTSDSGGSAHGAVPTVAVGPGVAAIGVQSRW
jgi:hypothetical protein